MLRKSGFAGVYRSDACGAIGVTDTCWKERDEKKMKGRLAELIEQMAQPGVLQWIGIREARLQDMRSVKSVCIRENGRDGDHGRAGKRAVTLIQAEHLSAIGSYLGQDAIAPDLLRRNLVVEGINLSALKGRQVRVGSAVLEITCICAPCSRMEEILGFGGYSAMRGHGGWCARVIEPGQILIGDPVTT